MIETPESCTEEKPFFNTVTGRCEMCMVGTEWDSQKQQCVQTNYIGLCPKSFPFYNLTSNRCEACPEGMVYNEDLYHCEEGEGEGETENEGSNENGKEEEG